MMPEIVLNTEMLHHYLNRWKAGDRLAADELLRAAGARLERLARRMCRSFPNVREWAETGDVLQGSLIRLLRTLQTITPKSSRDFFNLAAVHIRRELLDLARRYRGRGWLPIAPSNGLDSTHSDGAHPASPALPDDFDLWCRFHEAVDQLEPDEREVVGLVFYHGWTQREIAKLFQVDERTVRRRWQTACERLRMFVGQPTDDDTEEHRPL